MREFIALIITVGILGLVALLARLYWKIDDIIYKKKEEKALKKYPDFYEFVGYVRGIDRQKSKLVCETYDLKKKINTKTENLIFLTKEDIIIAEEEIENFRQQLKELNEKIKPLEEKSKELWNRVETWKKEIEEKGGKIY